MKLSFDIAIVGGGTAGLSAAREISKKCDANIVIVEEHYEIGQPPASSAFTFVDVVRKHRLENAVERYYSKVGMYSFLGSKAIYRFSVPRLAVLNYAKICQELLLQSKKDKIEVFCGTKATRIKRMHGKIEVELEGLRESSLKCNLLIDASGSSFFVSRFFPFKIPSFFSHAYGYELENCNIPNTSLDELSFFVGSSIGSGGGWFYPISKNRCTFGVAEIAHASTFPETALTSHYEFAKHNMQPFSEMIRTAYPIQKKAGSIPAEPMKDLVSNNIMRVGDTAGHATPHMLEGIRPSIEFGSLCGRIAAEAYDKNDFRNSFLKKYEKTWQFHNKMLHLYLLSMAEVYFSYDDQKHDEAIRRSNPNINPEGFLRHLRGDFDFPFSIVALIKGTALDIDYLKILMRFIYHNTRWFVS